MLRGALVGFGRMGMTHYSILNTHPEVELVAVCDTSSFMLRNVARHLKVATYKDFHRMFLEVRPDFAIVATPTVFHADVAAQAVACHAHVFVEKPLAMNPAEGHRLLDSLPENGLVHQVGYAIRFNDIFMKVKELLDADALGELLRFKMEMNGPTVLHGSGGGWRSRNTQGGGCLCDFACHAIDLINYLIGPPDQIVGTVLQSIYSREVEDAASSTFVYRSGLLGNLLVNWSDPCCRKPAYRFEALGARGKIIADLHMLKVFFRQVPHYDGFASGWNQRSITDLAVPVRSYVRGFEYTRQLDYFIDCILEKKPSEICPFTAGCETDEIIDRMRRDAETSGRHLRPGSRTDTIPGRRASLHGPVYQGVG